MAAQEEAVGRIGVVAPAAPPPRWLASLLERLLGLDGVRLVRCAAAPGTRWVGPPDLADDGWTRLIAALVAPLERRLLAAVPTAREPLSRGGFPPGWHALPEASPGEADLMLDLTARSDGGPADRPCWRLMLDEPYSPVDGERLGGRILRTGPEGPAAHRFYVKASPYSARLGAARLLWMAAEVTVHRVAAWSRGHGGAITWTPEPAAPPVPVVEARTLASHAIGMASRLMHRALRSVFFEDEWYVALRRAGPASPDGGIAGAGGWVRVPTGDDSYLADPFLWAADDRLFLVCEEWIRSLGRGVISVRELDAEGRALAPVRVLEQPWHLSYPQVFAWDGRWWMVPESRRAGTVELYECEQVPDRWRPVAALLSGVDAADATLVEKDGAMWMFVVLRAAGSDGDDALHLFQADTPMGPWRPHPANPIVVDPWRARMAGPLFQTAAGEWIRPAQLCGRRYGEAVVFHRVVEWSPTRYREEPFSMLSAQAIPGAAGCHTYGRVGGFEVIDVATARPRWSLLGRLPWSWRGARVSRGVATFPWIDEEGGPKAPRTIVFNIAALVVGGAERQLLMLLDGLDRRRFSPAVIAFEDGPWGDRFRSFGIPVVIVPYHRGRLWAVLETRRRLRELKPALVHTIGQSPNYVGRLAAVLARVPHIVIGERTAPRIKSRGKRLIERALAPFTDLLIANSGHGARYYVSHRLLPRRKVAVVGNGIDTDAFPHAHGSSPSGRPRIGFVGGMVPAKDHETLLRALRHLVDANSACELHLAGDGPLRAKIEARIRELGLDDHVVVHGWLDDVPRFFDTLDLYVHAAHYEGLPNALMEAMACGLPCVSFDTEGCNELITHRQTGLLVPPGDARGLADAVTGLLADRHQARALGAAGRERIRSEFSIAALVRNSEALYDAVLNGTPASNRPPIHIAVFEPYVFDNPYGNLRFTLGMLKHLDRRRHRPLFIAQRDAAFLDDLRDMGIATQVVSPPERLGRYGGALLDQGLIGRLSSALAALRYAWSLRRTLLEGEVDVLQCHNLRALLIAGPAAKLAGIPVIWYVKGHLDNPLLDRVGYRLADRVLFQSPINRDRRYPRLVQRHTRKIRIVPNGIDLDTLEAPSSAAQAALKQELGWDASTCNIVYVGQVSPLKGVDLLVEALAAVRVTAPATRLYIVGDECNPEYRQFRDRLETLIERHDLRDAVRFTGYRTDALRIVAMADIFVLPSLSEGVPRSVMEAMALGRAVVATSVGGVPDLVRDGVTGKLVPAGEVGPLAEALRTLVSDAASRAALGYAAREDVLAAHDIRATVRKLESVYDEILKERRWQ